MVNRLHVGRVVRRTLVVPRPKIVVLEDAGKATDADAAESDHAREAEEENVGGSPAAVVAVGKRSGLGGE